MNRLLGLILAGALIVGVVVAIVVSGGDGAPSQGDPVTVYGVIGSEKKPFFEDPRVKAEFRRKGYRVEVDTAGSRQIATSVNLDEYDFAFPAGAPAGEKIKLENQLSSSYTVFYTPMVIASWRPIADLLVEAGVADQRDGWYSFDIGNYLKLVKANTRWTDLPGNTVYPAEKSILITSTDVRTSNSAAMYLSLASYVVNGNNVVENSEQADALVPQVAPIFLRQGFTAASSEEPFEDYLAIGIGKTPMVMIYEAQFLSREFLGDGSITPDMVLMYPEPDVLSKHTFVPITSDGDAVGNLLLRDPVLERLAIDYGFRTARPGPFLQRVRESGVEIPSTIVDLIEPPSYESLEYMIVRIEDLYGPA
jgi:hypothetical protein